MQTDENKNNNHNEISKENISITKATTPTKKKSPYKILLVDDDDGILISIKHCLEDNDFIVDTFSSPLEAISAFQPELYDLLLIDIKMPEMNGFELYQELRKKANNVNIKTCFITAYEIYYETLKKEFPQLNVGCFISKPIESTNLVRRIREELQIQV